MRGLCRNESGNTLMIVAAALLPLLAMVGSGVDMGRAYLAQSRLQQACDAGVLAARKRLGTEATVSEEISDDVAMIGHRFFDINYGDGSYATTDRSFEMTLESDYAVSGKAAVAVPTTIMHIFGSDQVDLTVECEAQINFANIDVMLVLDVTGSMATANPGDPSSRMDVLRSTVEDFHTQLEATTKAGSVIRYGFVPYSTNVNVLHLLKDEWVVDEWAYQSRASQKTTVERTRTYETGWTYLSGSRTTTPVSSYAANFSEIGGYYCNGVSGGSLKIKESKGTKREEVFAGPPAGIRTIETKQRTTNGTQQQVQLGGTTCTISDVVFTDHVIQFDRVTEPSLEIENEWLYGPYAYDVGDWRTTSNGCIEERDTYEIDDYDNVDLARAIDLDLDRVPSSSASETLTGLHDPEDDDLFGGLLGFLDDDDDDDDDDGSKGKKGLGKLTLNYSPTQWRPMYPDWIFLRELQYDGSGSFSKREKRAKDNYISPVAYGSANCPAPARDLAPMSKEQLTAYLAALKPAGSTYHDIGMIWGGRLISPTGMFGGALSAREGSKKNLIFLTDGDTDPIDISYSSYGVEPLDQRRWSPDSPLSLTETVEKRFLFACREVRKRNVTVWIIGFGTELNQTMKTCAGDGHYFEAADAAELNASFGTIANDVADLRIRR